jgi:hypothetical protein
LQKKPTRIMARTRLQKTRPATSSPLASSLNAPYGARPWEEDSADWAVGWAGENSVSAHSPAAALPNATYSAHSVAGPQLDGSETDDSGTDSPGLYGSEDGCHSAVPPWDGSETDHSGTDSPGLYGSEDGCRSAVPPWDGSERALRFRARELSNSDYSWFLA